MTEQGPPSPQRIGDAERDSAAELLREHMAQGRLTAEEFDERIEAALTAKVASDLDPLFRDLPGPRPGQTVATTQPYATPPWQRAAVAPTPTPPLEPERYNRALAALASAIWPVTILFIVFGPDWASWWLLAIPIVVSAILGNDHLGRDRERKQIEDEQRKLDRRRRALEKRPD